MNIITLIDEINNYYDNGEYEKTLMKIENYFNMDSIGIFDRLMNIYIDCLIKLGRLNDAYKNLELMLNMYPYYYSVFDMIIKYIDCCKEDKVNELLENNMFSIYEIFYIARRCYFNGIYDKSLELFKYFVENSNSEFKNGSALEYIRKIELYKENSKLFLDVSYSYFKSMGCKLEPGYIICVDKVLDYYKENEFNDDPKISKRPYMVWRIEGNKIYAFPISTQVKREKDDILKKEDYPVRNFDRVALTGMVCLRENDVLTVIDKVNKEDYQEIINALYRSVCCMKDVPKVATQYFVKKMTEELVVLENDVIVVRDIQKKKQKYYYVIEKDKNRNKYKVIELEHEYKDFKIRDMKLSEISMKTPVLSIIKLDKKQIHKIKKEIPINFKNVDLSGSIIKYNGINLELMLDEKEFYVCINRSLSYPPSYYKIIFIDKNLPIEIVSKLDDCEYNSRLYTFSEYLKNNMREYNSKKDRFLKEKRKKR